MTAQEIKHRHGLSGLSASLIICAALFYSTSPSYSSEKGNKSVTCENTESYSHPVTSASEVYDIDAAKELCDRLPLRAPEGIWVYPDDNVLVLILRRPAISPTSLSTYDIRVVETSDVRLKPGDNIGNLSETPESNRFVLELFTECKDKILTKPKTCMARLVEDGEAMILSKEKSKFNFRFTLNPSTLLPKMWKILRMNTSFGSNNSASQTPAIGLVKIYPSYDGNGSSKREPRYL